ncbi:MAG: UvrD-helicase domain-containing protein [Planctomycetes bacterium]|nr:UvrD-helicase domain-containing protein [Planctomycetota bacterium]
MTDAPGNNAAHATMTLSDAQRDGIERTDLSMAVTSGAGCGKTLVLTRRYVKALIDDGRPDATNRVVAVTFTDKAAIEMRQRIASLLTDRLATAGRAGEKAMLGEWVSRLSEARISTIHGFCASLLRANAVAAQIDPAFNVLADEFQRRRLQETACTDAVEAALECVEENLGALLDEFKYDQIISMLSVLLQERWRWSPDDYANSADILDRWRHRLDLMRQQAWQDWDKRSVLAEMKALADWPCAKADDKLAVHMSEQLTAINRIASATSTPEPEYFANLNSRPGGIGSAKAWGSSETVKQVRHRLNALVEQVQQFGVYFQPLNDNDGYSAMCLQALTVLAHDAISRYATAKRRSGVLDFVDLQVEARNLLLNNDDVRRRTAAEINHLLIDEFQDTDSLQHQLLYLAVDCRGPDPTEGKVFFVGDAKQSIYRFRGAEVEVFNSARDAMGQRRRRNLDLSFRTHAAGLAVVNRIFSQLIGPAYEPLRANRTACPPAHSAEIILARCPDGANALDRLRATAKTMAGRIAEMIRDPQPRVWNALAGRWRPVRAGDIAVLLPRLVNTSPYEEAFHEAAVNHYVVAGAGLFRQQELFDLLNALRAIDNPLDDVALMGFLRGDMVGLDDNALLHVARTTTPPYRDRLGDDQLADRLGSAAFHRLRWAADLLNTLLAEKDAVEIAELIEMLLSATGFTASLLGQHQGQRKCGNVHRALALARSADEAGASLREFIDFLTELTVREIRAEQAATDTEGGDVVRIMTIHKAKGLEFPVVFLADLNYTPRPRSGSLGVSGTWGLTLKVGSDGDEDQPTPQSCVLAEAIEHRAEQAEDVRALYVAATRHCDYLAFVGAAEQGADGRFGQPGSTLRMLDDTLGIGQALSAGKIELDGSATILVNSVEPPRLRRETAQSLLEQLYDRCDSPDALADALAKPAQPPSPEALPYLPAVRSYTIERLVPTTMAELEFCPARFHWHYELRVPLQVALDSDPNAPLPGEPAGQPAPAQRPSLAPAAAGTIFHRCMELLDFDNPQPAAALVRLAVAAQQDDMDPAPLTADLKQMLEKLRWHELWSMLTRAKRRLRELEFLTTIGRLEIQGVIDLLVQTDAGRWCIIDYKSDRIRPADVTDHAQRYHLQMLIYAAAAGRLLKKDAAPSAEGIAATLYFLRPGLSYTFEAEALLPRVAERRLADLADQLAEYRRTNTWPQRADHACRTCPYATLCQVQPA